MATHVSERRRFFLDRWLVEPEHNRISNAPGTTPLQPKMMEVLLCLAERAGETVTRDELLQSVWRDLEVRDNVLHRTISKLRKALGDGRPAPRLIKTISRKGYCLTAAVRPAEPAPGAAVPCPAYDAGGTRASSPTPARPARPRWVGRLRLPMSVAAAFLLGAWLASPDDGPPVAAAVGAFSPFPGGAFRPSFSPDGRQVAFTWPNGIGADLYVQPIDGDGLRQLTSDAAYAYSPVWSPDGRTIAYYAVTPGHPSDCGIYTVPAAGGPARRLAGCDEERLRGLLPADMQESLTAPAGRGGRAAGPGSTRWLRRGWGWHAPR
jgi:DNA-binding winged helix-turn-helix (wHTH) protein